MTYQIKRKNNGFFVCDKKRCFSNKPLTQEGARKQQIAISLSESRKTGKPVGYYMK